MNKKYAKLIAELHLGMKETMVDMELCGVDVSYDELACEMAEGLLFDEPWVNKYLMSIGVRDVKGRFADDIYSGRV